MIVHNEPCVLFTYMNNALGDTVEIYEDVTYEIYC